MHNNIEKSSCRKEMTETQAIRRNFLKRDFLAAFVIIVNTFSWYFPLYFFFQDALVESHNGFSPLLVTLSIHYIGTIGAAIMGTVFVRKLSRKKFLSLWMLIGVVASAILITLDAENVPHLMAISFFLGVSLGLGFPSGLAYFGDHSHEENRGRLGGITFLASGLSMLTVGLLISISTFVVGVLIFALWRGIGLILFYFVEPKKQEEQSQIDISYKSVLLDRHFVLYYIPWVMFCLVNLFEVPIVNNFVGAEFALLISISEYGVGGLSALVAGQFADYVGRKRMVIIGFMILGVGYAVLGLFSNIIISWYLYIILDGIAWGIFILMFYLVIWADLAKNRAKEKYYLIGVLPFIVSGYIQILFTPHAQSIPISVAFSLASFFLFLAVLPLLYAPETLSEKEMEKKRLQKYLEDVKKVKMKHEK